MASGTCRFRTSWRSIRRRPTDWPHPEAHLHAEFYPAYRMPGRLKYLAGSEIGAGVFTADTRAGREGRGAAGGRGERRCLSESAAAGARTCQPDRRAHRLSRRLRAADDHSAAHRACDPAARAMIAASARQAPRSDGRWQEYAAGHEAAGRGWLDYVQGVTATLARARHRRPGIRRAHRVRRSSRRPACRRAPRSRSACCARCGCCSISVSMT